MYVCVYVLKSTLGEREGLADASAFSADIFGGFMIV